MKRVVAGGALFVLTMLVAGAVGEPPSAVPGYHVIQKLELGGDGGWDYLTCDTAAHRLYIARANRVMVVDLDTGKLAGEIANTPGVHGVALIPEKGKGFISNGGDNTVTVFDLKTLAETARIPVGKRPDAILYDAASGRVFTGNGGGGDATAIDVATEKVAGTVPLGGKPEAWAADGKGMVYVNIEDKGEVLAIDAHTLKVARRYAVAPEKEPVGLAVDPVKRRLFVSCHSEKMVVLDADSGKVLGTAPIGKGTDAAAFDPETGLAFSANGDGTLTVVHEDGPGQFAVAETVATQAGARTMALDPKTHRVYLVTAKPKPGQRRAYEPNTFVVLVVGK